MSEKVRSDKENYYKELVGGQNPDAIFILSGGTVKRDRGFTTASYGDTQGEYGVLGGKARIIAAVELVKYFPETKLVMTATHYPTPEDPSQSSVMADELRKLGVKQQQIVTEEYSKSTYDELSRIVALSRDNKYRRVVVLTNEYHVPRAEEMLNRLGELAANRNDTNLVMDVSKFNEEVNTTFIAAEDILIKRNPHYAKVIKEVQKLPGYRQRLLAEDRGLEALRSGTYGKSK